MNKRKPLLLLVLIPLLLTAGVFSFVSAQEESQIPAWIKTAIGFWVNEQVSDEEFLKAIEYFIENKIIQVPSQTTDDILLINNLQILQAEINLKTEQSYELVNIPEIQQLLAESNASFARTGSPEEIIRQVEERWQSSDPDVPDSIAFNLIHNPAANVIRSIMDVDQKSESQFKYAEIFITNQYGGNIAQSNKTTDYKQVDEL